MMIPLVNSHIPIPNAPGMEYLSTFGSFFGVNEGQNSIYGASGRRKRHVFYFKPIVAGEIHSEPMYMIFHSMPLNFVDNPTEYHCRCQFNSIIKRTS